MEIVDFILHIGDKLDMLFAQYGTLLYWILFLIVFAETGFVVTPFLPGDSLLFAAGMLAANSDGVLSPYLIILVCIVAAFLGNTVNYKIGNFFGPKIFEQEKIRFIKKEYLIKTHDFYEKHGTKAIVIGRFLPFIRTFVPFVAGVGSMDWKKFSLYNLIGAVLWVTPFTLAGFFLGKVPFVEQNFEKIMLSIIFITVLPTFIGIFNEWRKNSKKV
ncbi:MAG: DedA family protein [Bacteroidetes bacterium]|nr:DedA family protein [Bacteroidota bacterium]MBK9353844.1 DedA family protein [Bacteroidota bacterium]